MKSGASKQDQNKIRRLVEKGSSAEEISKRLKININCIESFVNYFKPAKKTKAKKIAANQKPDNPGVDVQTQDA